MVLNVMCEPRSVIDPLTVGPTTAFLTERLTPLTDAELESVHPVTRITFETVGMLVLSCASDHYGSYEQRLCGEWLQSALAEDGSEQSLITKLVVVGMRLPLGHESRVSAVKSVDTYIRRQLSVLTECGSAAGAAWS